MLRRIYAGVDLRDPAIGVNEERVAGCEFDQDDIGQRAIGLHDFVTCVGQEFEIEALPGAKLLMRIDAISAHP